MPLSAIHTLYNIKVFLVLKKKTGERNKEEISCNIYVWYPTD